MADLSKEGCEQLLVLSFAVETQAGPISCGMNVHKIREVIETSELSPLPKEYAPFVAMYDLRGMPIPVMPLSAIFNRDGVSAPVRSGRILVIELQGRVIGLVVARTGAIREFRNADVLEPPTVLERAKSRLFNGMVKDQKGYVYLLDIESILDSYGLSFDKEEGDGIPPSIFRGKRVLVVEDSKLYQKKIKSMFTAWGCELEIAANGKEAIELIERKKGAFDLIFSDVEMPVMNGIEMAVKLKEMPAFSQIPIIFNSSLSNVMLIEEIKEKGLGGYIVKFDQTPIREEMFKVFSVAEAKAA